MTETVNHPKHYQHPSGVECWEISILLPHALGSAFEYVWRHENKGGVEDLRKARWWLEYSFYSPSSHFTAMDANAVSRFKCSADGGVLKNEALLEIIDHNEDAAISVIDQMISELIA